MKYLVFLDEKLQFYYVYGFFVVEPCL